MTREEAINKLVNARYADEFQGDEELTEAHLMAIKALEQEPCEKDWRFYYDHGYAQAKRDLSCDDAISRQAVLDGIDTYIYKAQSTGTQDDFYSFAELVVKALPSVTQKSETVTEFADRCRECGAKYGKLLKQEPYDFARWVATEIFDEMWEYNKDAFAELACRKLAKLGIVRANGDEWVLVESEE